MRNRNRWTIEVSAMVLAAAVAVSTGGMTAEAASVDALEEAARHGVRILFLPCHVEPDSLTITNG